MSERVTQLRKNIYALVCDSNSTNFFSILIDRLLLLLIACNVIAVMLETIDKLHQQYHLFFKYFEWFSVAIFTIEYLLRIFAEIEDKEFQGLSKLKARFKYALKPMALIDLFAILPFYLAFIFNIDLRFLRVLRLLRIFKLTRYSEAMQLLLVVLHKEMQSFAAALFVLLTLMVMAASGIYLVEQEAQPELFSSIPESLWWAIVTLSTVGYGDMYPITPMGKVFGSVITIIGVGMVALPAGIIASGFSEELHNRKEEYKKDLRQALADGIIDASEEEMLEKQRKKLGLTKEDVELIKNSFEIDSKENKTAENKTIQLVYCPHCSKSINLE